MTRTAVLAAFALALLSIAVSAQTPPSMRQKSVLDSDIVVATQDDPALRAWAEWRAGATFETVTELRPGAPAFAIARVTGCMVEYGKCNVNVDYTIYRPDNSVYKELKLQAVENGQLAPRLNFTLGAADPAGLYRVVATVRDLNARRTQRPERLFSLRLD